MSRIGTRKVKETQNSILVSISGNMAEKIFWLAMLVSKLYFQKARPEIYYSWVLHNWLLFSIALLYEYVKNCDFKNYAESVIFWLLFSFLVFWILICWGERLRVSVCLACYLFGSYFLSFHAVNSVNFYQFKKLQATFQRIFLTN